MVAKVYPVRSRAAAGGTEYPGRRPAAPADSAQPGARIQPAAGYRSTAPGVRSTELAPRTAIAARSGDAGQEDLGEHAADAATADVLDRLDGAEHRLGVLLE